MKRYHGTDKVTPGIYLCLRQLSFASMEDEGRLPGSAADVYRRVPAVVLLVVAPLVGLAYVIFLPLIGFLMLGRVVLGKAAELALEAAVALGRVLRPAWQPAWAFLSRGRAGARRRRGRDRWAEEVEEELEAGEAEPDEEEEG